MGSHVDLQPLDATQLRYTYTTAPRKVPDAKDLACTHKTICTEHMSVASWNVESGWSIPELKPYGPFSLLPSAFCLLYAYECFEGLKGYRGHDGKLRMFRADYNTHRLLMSAERISLPQFDPDELENIIYAMISVGGAKWLPKNRTGDFLSVLTTQEAFRQGYHQILWLYGSQGDCTEAAYNNPVGRNRVTRRSCLDLVRERLKDELQVAGHKFTIGDIQEAAAEGQLPESFAAGTARSITPISVIHHHGRDINIHVGPDDMLAEYTRKIKGRLSDIIYGCVEHKCSRVDPEKELKE